MSFSRTIVRKAIKSAAAYSFVRPYGLETLIVVTSWVSWIVYRGSVIRLTDSTFRRARTSCASREVSRPVLRI